MARQTGTKRQARRGSAVIELLLALPSIALALMLLVTMSETLVLRQEGLVAARQAAFLDRLTGKTTSAADALRASSARGEPWRLERREGSSGLGSFAGAFSTLGELAGLGLGTLSSSDAAGAVSYQVKRQPDGLFARTLRLGEASAQYELERGTWTSSQCGGFAAALKDKVSILRF
ncbi:MAG: hypothetical protein GC160_04400 [Acidobacteria bacterium]|nr:hypothetical protein [Acidobacteriota bacterium]